MKKIIKSSVLFLGVCFFALQANAQLSSEKPALTAEQLKAMISNHTSAAKTTAAEPASSMPVVRPSETPAKSSVSSPASVTIQTTINTADASKATTTSLTSVSDQGAVKPIITEQATQVKIVQVPMQSEKVAEKPVVKPKEQ